MVKSISEFSPEVVKEIGFYVYRLIDPRNGNTFYVGKGKDNRVFAHMNDALVYENEEDELSEKIGTIREIHQCGLNVIHVIHRHGLDDDTAYEVEAALIDAFPGLSNEASGRGSRDRGAMNALQIQNVYKAEVIEKITDKCIIIKITQPSVDSHNDVFQKAVYEATRSAWRLKMSNAVKAEYVLSVLNGIVVAVYSEIKWEYAACGKRLFFEAKEAPVDICEKYIGKRIPPEFRQKGNASPCQYVNIF